MHLQHIIAATDESDAGRQAVRTALEIACRCSARVTVMRVVAVEAAPRLAGMAQGMSVRAARDEEPELERLRRWLDAGVFAGEQVDRLQLGIAFGIPGIEICRYAERNACDLLVLGRKRHSPMMRLLLGDTADAVARRSRSPSLLVQHNTGSIRKVLVALDGSDRGMIVLHEACEFASQVGASLQAMTVEASPSNEPSHLVTNLPLTRSSALQGKVREAQARHGLPHVPLIIRRGDVLERVIAEAQEMEADLLVTGYHRGGPPGVLEAGSTARRMAHASPCAVMTIPL